MSFNRLKYDNCEEKKNIDESIGPGIYQVGTPVLCGSCYQDNPQIRLQKTGNSMNSGVDLRFNGGPIDIDSELKNINHPISRCPSNKYSPKCDNYGSSLQGQPCGQGVVSGYKETRGDGTIKRGGRSGDGSLIDYPTCHFDVEDTRLSNPPNTLRGTGWNRFQPLCLDPQEQVLFPGEYQIPTRLVAKDNHRPCVPTPSINNMIPKPSKLPCPNTQPVCGSFTSAMYQYDVCG